MRSPGRQAEGSSAILLWHSAPKANIPSTHSLDPASPAEAWKFQRTGELFGEHHCLYHVASVQSSIKLAQRYYNFPKHNQGTEFHLLLL